MAYAQIHYTFNKRPCCDVTSTARFWSELSSTTILCVYKHQKRELSGRVLDSRPSDCKLEPHCCVTLMFPLERHVYICLVLVQPRKTRPGVTEKLFTRMQRIKSNKQTKQTAKALTSMCIYADLTEPSLRVD